MNHSSRLIGRTLKTYTMIQFQLGLHGSAQIQVQLGLYGSALFSQFAPAPDRRHPHILLHRVISKFGRF
ncbi:hypothetical protein HanIR_Chr17g0879341 [Helianthus annuus]|nr:hypothetical protein HanIR_Chr17g0879341 [Helianthus annuus]